MLGSTMIEVGIGLAFVYFLLSVICTAINDVISEKLNWRSENLHEGIRNLLRDETLASQVWNHAIVRGMTGRGKEDPTNIPPNTFALVLFDAIAPAQGSQDGLVVLGENLKKLPDGSARQALVAFVDAAEHKAVEARKNVADWFDAAMVQVSIAYKQRMQLIAFIVGLVIAGILELDTLAIANTLYREPSVRAAVTNAAQANQATMTQANQGQSLGDVKQNVQGAVQSLESLGIPMGWTQPPTDPWGWVKKGIGIVLTAGAASAGSPFWYELLRNLLGLVKPQTATASANKKEPEPRNT